MKKQTRQTYHLGDEVWAIIEGKIVLSIIVEAKLTEDYRVIYRLKEGYVRGQNEIFSNSSLFIEKIKEYVERIDRKRS